MLGASGLPPIFRLADGAVPELPILREPGGHCVRLWARSLHGMQKEAVIGSTRTGAFWRLASDEGPYLRGFDRAPCPLAFFTTGLVASCMNEIVALAAARGIGLDDIVLQLDNFYEMTGSAPQRTMRAAAYAPRLVAGIDSRASEPVLAALLHDAVSASPLCALVRKPLVSRFALTVDGKADGATGAELAGGFSPRGFDGLTPAAGGVGDGPVVAKLSAVRTAHGVAGGFATSFAPAQDRRLHIRGTCRLMPDGTREIIQELFSPLGSSWRFVSDEAPGSGGEGRAPDAATYVAAGIGFCFMTQIGRYAYILRREPGDYRIVQRLRLSNGASGRSDRGDCKPVETHLFIDQMADDGFPRELLAMGEQTCFLHALCRSGLEMEIELRRGTAAVLEGGRSLGEDITT